MEHVFSRMMDPIKYHVVQFLSIKEFVGLCKVDVKLSEMVDDKEIWQCFLYIHFPCREISPQRPSHSRDFKRKSHDPKTDYRIQLLLKEWKNLVRLNKYESYWKMLKIASFGLSENLVIGKSSLQEKRILGILDKLTSSEYWKIEYIRGALNADLKILLWDLLQEWQKQGKISKRSDDFVQNIVEIAVLNEILYRKLSSSENFAFQFVKNHHSINNTGKRMFDIFQSANRGMIGTLPLNDVILRNL